MADLPDAVTPLNQNMESRPAQRFSTPAVSHPLARVSGEGRNRLRQKHLSRLLRGQDETRYSSADINAVYSHLQLATIRGRGLLPGIS